MNTEYRNFKVEAEAATYRIVALMERISRSSTLAFDLTKVEGITKDSGERSPVAILIEREEHAMRDGLPTLYSRDVGEITALPADMEIDAGVYYSPASGELRLQLGFSQREYRDRRNISIPPTLERNLRRFHGTDE